MVGYLSGYALVSASFSSFPASKTALQALGATQKSERESETDRHTQKLKAAPLGQ